MANPFDKPDEPQGHDVGTSRDVLLGEWLNLKIDRANDKLSRANKRDAGLSEETPVDPKIVETWHSAFGEDFNRNTAAKLAVRIITRLSNVRPDVEPNPSNVEMPGRAYGEIQPKAQQDIQFRPAPPPQETIESGDRVSGSGSTAFAALRQSIVRAAHGGRPVSILHYGASHVAGGTEAQTIATLFQEKFPVTYTTKAKRGVSALYPLENKVDWLSEPIAKAQPDLIILAFGNNESASRINSQSYKKSYEELVREVQRRAPGASIMLVGPTDGCSIRGANKGHLLPGLEQVIQVQREVAHEFGLDYYDFQEAMGGRNSIYQWKARGLVSGDMLHFSKQGYQILGKMLFNHVMEQSGIR